MRQRELKQIDAPHETTMQNIQTLCKVDFWEIPTALPAGIVGLADSLNLCVVLRAPADPAAAVVTVLAPTVSA